MAAQPALLGRGVGVLAEGVVTNVGSGKGGAWVAAPPSNEMRHRPALSLRTIRTLSRPIH